MLPTRRPGHRALIRVRILGGGLRSWLAVRCTPGLSLTSLRPVSGGPFRKRPCTERVDAPLPARRPTEAYPLRYGEGGQRSRSGCSGPRMPGSDGMGPWRPVLLRLLRPVPGEKGAAGGSAQRPVEREGIHRGAGFAAASGTGSERAKVANVAKRKPPASRCPPPYKELSLPVGTLSRITHERGGSGAIPLAGGGG